MGGLGSVFPTGDAVALARRIDEFASRVRTSRTTGNPLDLPTSRGDMPLASWRDAVDLHLRDYSLANFETKFLRIVEELAPASQDRTPGWLTGAIATPDHSLRSA